MFDLPHQSNPKWVRDIVLPILNGRREVLDSFLRKNKHTSDCYNTVEAYLVLSLHLVF